MFPSAGIITSDDNKEKDGGKTKNEGKMIIPEMKIMATTDFTKNDPPHFY